MSEKERDEAEASKLSTQTFQLPKQKVIRIINIIFIFCYISAILQLPKMIFSLVNNNNTSLNQSKESATASKTV